ncbi:Uncharacterized protein APZ42_009853 [Daphnia magna]|uniref:Uncharacterized protein n=1 Tax=Daphnia magna TaxID=35525 RepID=A0A164DR84_9CRUS|nr:Uncharacterized protein APZ42_009853 [Daphnia magna]
MPITKTVFNKIVNDGRLLNAIRNSAAQCETLMLFSSVLQAPFSFCIRTSVISS